MANTRFFLDKRNAKDGKPVVLKLAIAHQHKSSLISLVKIMSSQWDDEEEKIVSHDDSVTLNAYINRIKSLVDCMIVRLMNEGILNRMTASDIKERCMDEIEPERKEKKEKAAEEKISFLYRFKRYAERMKPGSKRTYDHTLNRLEAFCAKPGQKALDKLKFEDITVDWLRDFDAFMAENCCKNTRNIHYRNMRTVFNEAIEDGITTHYPFRRFKIKSEVTAKRDLSVEELRRLIYFDCDECLVKYRDYFMLMFFLMGINNIDLCNLKEIKKGRLEFHRSKTNHFFSMKIEPEAMALLKKYKGQSWLINVLDHCEEPLSWLKQTNKALKKIGPTTRKGLGGKKEITSLFPGLTTYWARHTWASVAASLDIPIETISAGLGHEYGNRITAIYINYDNKKVDAANRKVIDWVLYGKINGVVMVEPGTPQFFGLKKKEAIKLGLVKGNILDTTEESREIKIIKRAV